MPKTTHSDTAPTFADGVLETRDGLDVLRFERHLPHPVERVWAAITEPEQIEMWLARAEVDLVEGGRFNLEWLNTDENGKRFSDSVMQGTITRLDPPDVLEVDSEWHGLMRWELRGERGGCALTFSSTLPSIDQEMRAKTLSGWHVHLDFLAEALDGEAVDWPNWPMDRWETHHERYIAKLS